MMTDKERNKMALKLIKMARQLTTSGIVDDYLDMAQTQIKEELSYDD